MDNMSFRAVPLGAEGIISLCMRTVLGFPLTWQERA